MNAAHKNTVQKAVYRLQRAAEYLKENGNGPEAIDMANACQEAASELRDTLSDMIVADADRRSGGTGRPNAAHAATTCAVCGAPCQEFAEDGECVHKDCDDASGAGAPSGGVR